MLDLSKVFSANSTKRRSLRYRDHRYLGYLTMLVCGLGGTIRKQDWPSLWLMNVAPHWLSASEPDHPVPSVCTATRLTAWITNNRRKIYRSYYAGRPVSLCTN